MQLSIYPMSIGMICTYPMWLYAVYCISQGSIIFLFHSYKNYKGIRELYKKKGIIQKTNIQATCHHEYQCTVVTDDAYMIYHNIIMVPDWWITSNNNEIIITWNNNWSPVRSWARVSVCVEVSSRFTGFLLPTKNKQNQTRDSGDMKLQSYLLSYWEMPCVSHNEQDILRI